MVFALLSKNRLLLPTGIREPDVLEFKKLLRVE